jgi:alkylhydroperoxidase family enzyme
MRLREVEKGDGLAYRLLIKFISMVSGMRLPDAARIVMYHQDFYGKPMTTWTHAAMRGESNWSVGEREFFAAMIAKWNSCTFCVDAHSSIASLVLEKSMVDAAIDDFRQAKLPSKLYAILVFLEVLTKTPDNLTSGNVREVLNNGISAGELEDAIAICTLFSITVRCADTFNFALLDNKDSARAAKRMLKQGYVFGKTKNTGRPDHRTFAEMLRKRILEEPGKTDTKLRQAIAYRTTGGPAIEEYYDELALCIGKAAYKCTDELIKKVIKNAGSEKAAFELITAAAIGAGLYRWDKGLSVLKETC